MVYSEIVKFLVAMIIMMNPLGSLSIYLQLTRRASLRYQRKTAIRCWIAISVIMIVTLLIGKEMLDLLGITLPSFRFAGGIIMLLVGLSMLQSQESPLSHTHADDVAAEQRDSIAVVPMALPTIIGPGSMTTLILASNDYPYSLHKLVLCFLCLLLAASMGLILYFGSTIANFVGDSVIKVITRVMGMFIMAIAVGMLASGLMGLFPALVMAKG